MQVVDPVVGRIGGQRGLLEDGGREQALQRFDGGACAADVHVERAVRLRIDVDDLEGRVVRPLPELAVHPFDTLLRVVLGVGEEIVQRAPTHRFHDTVRAPALGVAEVRAEARRPVPRGSPRPPPRARAADGCACARRATHPRDRSAWRAASRRDGRGTSSSRARHDAPARRAARRRPRGLPGWSRSTTPRRRGWRGSLSRHSGPRCPGTRCPSRGAGCRPTSARPPIARRVGAPAARQCQDRRRRRGRGSSGPAAGSASAGRSRGWRSDAPSNPCAPDAGLPAPRRAPPDAVIGRGLPCGLAAGALHGRRRLGARSRRYQRTVARANAP